ncbi:HEAT repeat domain-containing protein [Spirillospora sp. NPDC000708]
MFMMSFLREFGTWNWTCEFDDPVLRGAYAAMGAATTPQEFERAFLVLLRSEDTVAIGAALDYYDRARTTSRFGEDSPFEAHRDEVIARARALLRQPPRPADERGAAGANHASALSVLRNEAGPQDAEPIFAILRAAPPGGVDGDALSAAGLVLNAGPVPHAGLLALVIGIAGDRSRDPGERREALRALPDAPAPEITALLLEAIGDEDPDVRLDAAAALCRGPRFYAHRRRLEDFVATWPEDRRPWGVAEALSEGRHSLYWTDHELDGPRLREAHRQLRTPTGEAAHRRAFRTLLHSGRTAAVGIALDHFTMTDGLTRFGMDVERYTDDVLALARHLLRLPPCDDGAVHASAWGVLAEHAGPADAPLIAEALLDTPVLDRAVHAAGRCLEHWTVPSPEIVRALETLICDTGRSLDDREDCVTALFDLASPDVTAVLLRALRSPELPIQIEAAVGLTFDHLLDDHRDLLADVVASWPQDAGYRARIVRSELARERPSRSGPA